MDHGQTLSDGHSRTGLDAYILHCCRYFKLILPLFEERGVPLSVCPYVRLSVHPSFCWPSQIDIQIHTDRLDEEKEEVEEEAEEQEEEG